jgi:hypothetical protein
MGKENSLTFSCDKDALWVINNDILYSDEEVSAAYKYISK